MAFGEIIRQYREKSGLTQEELASKVGVCKSMICRIERGTAALTVSLAKDIAAVLECKLCDIIGE